MATFRSEGLVGRKDPWANLPLELFFGPGRAADGGSAMVAWTSPEKNLIVLGYTYLQQSSLDHQAATLAHELLHRSNIFLNHQQIAQQLGIQYTPGNNPEGAANQALTDWIEQGCPDPD
jgi:hypothetical protein